MSITTNSSITRKRTHSSRETHELDTRPFSIREQANAFARPRTFTPLCLLSRAQLPLAFLDTSSTGSRIFNANVAVLEACYEHGEDESTVLIARELVPGRNGTEGRLFAIERVRRRCYALCRLGEWVTEEDVRQRSITVLRGGETKIKRRALESTKNGQPWWHEAAVGGVPPLNHSLQSVQEHPAESSSGIVQAGYYEPPPGIGRLPLPRLSMQRVMSAPQRISKSDAVLQELATMATTNPDESVPDTTATEIPQSPQDILKELTRHYLEALYLSRTSLAYFTKGPLSRARAAFSSLAAAPDMFELISLLRESVLTSTVMDKKYRDGIPGILKDISAPAVSTEISTTPQAKPAKKKATKWKAKRSKGGFFTGEQEYIERWWRNEDLTESCTNPAEETQAVLRRKVARIRNRETFLQVIIVLEVLALEVTNPAPTKEVLQIHELRGSIGEESKPAEESQKPGTSTKVTTKGKKRQDFPGLLETLLDKLCIWHELDSISPAKNRHTLSEEPSDAPSDELKSFCLEVIVPFYNSRLPEYAAIVNKKLGGPSAPSPVKMRKSRKPGEPAVREAPEKRVRQPLARVGTEILNRPKQNADVFGRPPSLQRSATDSCTTLSSTIRIKREGSETPLHTIPSVQSSRRPSLAPQLKAISKREVDLSAISATNEARMRKKRDVEAKLREAVEVLKKPNRSLAVKEMEERTDERFVKEVFTAKGRQRAGGNKRVRTSAGDKNAEGGLDVRATATPSSKGIRAGSGGVQATPLRSTLHQSNSAALHNSGNSFKSASTTHVSSSTSRQRTQPAYVQENPPSETYLQLPRTSAGDTSWIPQTGHRPRLTNATYPLHSSKPEVSASSRELTRRTTIAETPSRGFAKFMPAGLASRPGMLDTPSKSRSIDLHTPLVAASPNIALFERRRDGGEANRKEKSIYDSLGWDLDCENDGYEQLT